MKLVVVGSTGFVASEILRQALSLPDVTSIYALGRREISAPPSLGPEANASKLKSVILKDFERYTDDVKEALAGADAVIWTIATGPSKFKSVTWEQTCKTSRDYAIKGIDVISHLPREEKTKPLRFIYFSRASAE
ncbi:putative NAD(P)-binding domain-containing protein [Seiridium cardinale]|uniref:NAD(P)-binding domain-containing protein n=1 Tax=Seiridium cardinale TaxID=138064 RepID=A0ABR2Y2U3_9PEZI